MRQIVLDTETTGLEIANGNRVIEIGCVEMIDRKVTRRHYHQYINPERPVEEGAFEIHGLSDQFLSDKPLFADVWRGFLEFVKGAELIMHNAEFDTRFLDHELSLLPDSPGRLTDYCSIVDSLKLAQQKHPGQRNNLDALCKRYHVDNSQRDLHGALLDAEILADVYLLMTGGQVTLLLGDEADSGTANLRRSLSPDRPKLRVIRASDEELTAHADKCEELAKSADEGCLWQQLEAGQEGAL